MSFLIPAYLLGILGLFLPWLLHRFSDQQPDEQLFPSKRFLEETKPPVSRTRTLKYRALMAVRMLSVLLLCFLFAQPWLDNASDVDDSEMHHIIALDLSLSMRAGDSWEIAVTKARDLINQFGEDNSVELIGFDQALVRIADNVNAKADLLQGLNSLQPGYVSADYGVLMQRLNRLAVERSESVKVWIITDQQSSSMPAQKNALYGPDVNEFEIISTALEPQRNVHVRAHAHSDDGVNLRVSVQLRASVSQSRQSDALVTESINELFPSTISINADGKTLAQRTVRMVPSGIQTLVFDDLIMPPGESPVLSVSIDEADALVLDNRVSVVIKQANPTEVAALQSDSSTSRNALVFLSTALQTDAQASVTALSGIATQIAPSVQHVVSGRNLANESLELDIRQFVDEGKNALVFSSAVMSSAATPTLEGADVGLVDESHPMALGDINWSGTEFYDVPEIAIKKGDRILIETTQRQVILVERQVPKGRILLLNDRLDGQSSNLPFQPAFVDLMKSIVDYFDASTALPDLLTAGNRLVVAGNVQLLDPDNNSLLSLDEEQRQGGIALTRPGLYRVIGLSGPHIVNVQLDSNETDLTLASDDALSNWRKRFDGIEPESEGDSTEETAVNAISMSDSQAQRSRSRLWLWLLPLLAGALLIETLLANRRLDVRRDGS